MSIGVYFSANDAVYDWTIAFLNSFRTFNPNLELRLIPFNEECDRTLELQDKYDFRPYIDSSFTRLEEIGQSFELGHTNNGPFWFRRYASFWGEFSKFMYLDARQIILADLKPIIELLDQYSFDLLHFDCIINQVYEPGELRSKLLEQRRARGFNSGRWISRKGIFTITEFEQLASEALSVRQQLNARNTDQAFINYCCDLKPVQYGHIADILGHVCSSSWARLAEEIYQDNGKFFIWDHGGSEHKKQLLLIHWAGYKMNALMPHRYWFDFFYCKDMFIHKMFFYKFKNILEGLAKYLPLKLRQNRLVNTFYQKLSAFFGYRF